MTKLVLISQDGLSVSYDLSSINLIAHDKACLLYDKSDLAGNGIRPNDSLINIEFKDGNRSSFGSNWFMSFE